MINFLILFMLSCLLEQPLLAGPNSRLQKLEEERLTLQNELKFHQEHLKQIIQKLEDPRHQSNEEYLAELRDVNNFTFFRISDLEENIIKINHEIDEERLLNNDRPYNPKNLAGKLRQRSSSGLESDRLTSPTKTASTNDDDNNSLSTLSTPQRDENDDELPEPQLADQRQKDTTIQPVRLPFSIRPARAIDNGEHTNNRNNFLREERRREQHQRSNQEKINSSKKSNSFDFNGK